MTVPSPHRLASPTAKPSRPSACRCAGCVSPGRSTAAASALGRPACRLESRCADRASDPVIAAESVRPGNSHANYGLLPGAGASAPLPRRVRLARQASVPHRRPAACRRADGGRAGERRRAHSGAVRLLSGVPTSGSGRAWGGFNRHLCRVAALRAFNEAGVGPSGLPRRRGDPNLCAPLSSTQPRLWIAAPKAGAITTGRAAPCQAEA